MPAEANTLHQFLDLLLSRSLLDLVDLVAGVHDPPPSWLVDAKDGEAVILHVHLHVLDLVLHENALQLISLGEALELLVDDGTHESGLTALVWAQETVEAVSLQVHLGVAKQRQCTVGQGEGALVEVDAVSVLFLDLLLRLGSYFQLCPQLLDNTREGFQCSDVGLPLRGIEGPHVGGRGRQCCHVRGLHLEDLITGGLVTQGSLDLLQGLLRRDLLSLATLS
mmetsp:Transcript_42308/g.76508  ORF Transcript_42308/g.76508 Transcript_42308/m.76508 type:complete len:223 (+) Transcript_42308:1646-2314(+)